MTDEPTVDIKKYFQYLNEMRKHSENASPDNIEWQLMFFEKSASPYHYWKESQLLKPGEQPKPKLCTQKQIDAINKFLDNDEKLFDEIETKYNYKGKIEDMTLDMASKILGDWIARIKK